MKIAILGAAGRMGKMLCQLADGMKMEVVSKVDVVEGYDREWSKDVEGIIDFSYHTAVPDAIEKAAKAGVAYVIGTTGLTADEQARVEAAAKKIPVVQSGNYSLGDLRKFWEAVGLPEPGDMAAKNSIKNLVRTGSLKSFISLIQRGRRKALKAKERFSWNHFNQASADSERLAVGTDEAA